MSHLVDWLGGLVSRARALGDPGVITKRLGFVQKILSERGLDRTNLYVLIETVRKGELPLATAAGVLGNFHLDQLASGSIARVDLREKTGLSRREKMRLKLRGIREESRQRLFAGSLLTQVFRGQFLEISSMPPKEYQPPPNLFLLNGDVRVESWLSDFSLDDNCDESPRRMLEFRTVSPRMAVTTHIDLDRILETPGPLSEPILTGEEWRDLFQSSTSVSLYLFIRDSQIFPAEEVRQALNVTALWQIEYGAELFLDSLNPRWVKDSPFSAA
jgi:hypothetical protein